MAALAVVLFLALLSPVANASHVLFPKADSDTCAYLNNQPFKVKIGANTVQIGALHTCLCLSGISEFVASHAVTKASVAAAGVAATTSALTNLITTNGKLCTYPHNSTPVCHTQNVCAFTCKAPYVPHFNKKTHKHECACPHTHFLCSGQCVSSPCPSPTPRGPTPSSQPGDGGGGDSSAPAPEGRRDYIPSMNKRNVALCPANQTPCRIPGRGPSSWECIDTMNDLESCGGCAFSALYPSSAESQGQDCTEILGVSDVSCVRGKCIVERCTPGFLPSNNGSTCVPYPYPSYQQQQESQSKQITIE